MAERSRNLVITALTRAVTEGQPLPLHESRSTRGLFPSSAAAKQAARRCLDEGLLQSVGVEAPENPSSGCSFAITDKGYQFLLEQTSPRDILEDCLRVMESRKEQIENLLCNTTKLLRSFEAIKEITGRAVAGLSARPDSIKELCQKFRSQGPELPVVVLEEWLCKTLSEWSIQAGSGDCPLPDLFRAAGKVVPGLTAGAFHDALRLLHQQRRIYLHPWTGPLYRLPEPNLALMAGHEVAYYASYRNSEAA